MAEYSPLPPPYDEQEDFKYGVTVEQCHISIRMAFVRKVYTLLASQVGLTCVLGAVYLTPSVKQWAQDNSWSVLLSSILSFVLLFATLWNRRVSPTNLYLLTAFTLCEAHTVATIITFYDQLVVLQALILTFGIFVGLTLFTIQSKYDFSSMAPYLFGGLLSLIVASLVEIFLPFSSLMQFGISIFSALLFCGFIVFDTQQIFTRMSPEDYIPATLDLYLDLLNLFLTLLRLLNDRND